MKKILLYINKKTKGRSIKKKVAVVFGSIFMFCVICVVVANGIFNNVKTADYYLEQMAECQPAFNAMHNYTVDEYSKGIKALGKQKFFACVGAMFYFEGCAETTIDRVDQENPADKVYCACGAFQHKSLNTLSGELIYETILIQNGVKNDVQRYNTLENKRKQEEAKINLAADFKECSKYIERSVDTCVKKYVSDHPKQSKSEAYNYCECVFTRVTDEMSADEWLKYGQDDKKTKEKASKLLNKYSKQCKQKAK